VAARLLGYTKDVWEGCEQSPCLERYNYVLNKYAGLKWGDLTLAQQSGWTMLEHSQALWDAGGMMRTRLFSMRWDELSPAQQRQAAFLGYSKGTWQGCNFDWGTSINVTITASDFGGPFRTVRVRMVIEAAFSSISGNVYGVAVSTMPTSFIELFERSVGRSLFCGNPDFKNYTIGAFGPDGEPVCKLPEDYERQRQRIRVVTVLEGSIIVDFIIVKNQTAEEPPSIQLYEGLKTQLESFASPLCQDVEFGRYARIAAVEEVPLSDLDPEERQRAMAFEQTRGKYGELNACELSMDARKGKVRCPVASTRSSTFPVAFLLALVVLLSALPESCHWPTV